MDKNKVYIIGPHNSFQEELKAALEQFQALSVSIFPDGETCFMKKDAKSSFIIVDYIMGEGNWSGIEFMEEYKRIYPDTKFIVVSSSSLNLEKALEVVSKGAMECTLKTKSGIERLTKIVVNSILAF